MAGLSDSAVCLGFFFSFFFRAWPAVWSHMLTVQKLLCWTVVFTVKVQLWIKSSTHCISQCDCHSLSWFQMAPFHLLLTQRVCEYTHTHTYTLCLYTDMFLLGNFEVCNLFTKAFCDKLWSHLFGSHHRFIDYRRGKKEAETSFKSGCQTCLLLAVPLFPCLLSAKPTDFYSEKRDVQKP